MEETPLWLIQHDRMKHGLDTLRAKHTEDDPVAIASEFAHCMRKDKKMRLSVWTVATSVVRGICWSTAVEVLGTAVLLERTANHAEALLFWQ